MTNFIKVVTLIIAVSNGGFVLGNIGTDKDLSDSNSAMLASSEITTLVEEDEQKETSLMNGTATLSPETPVSIQPVTIPENPAAAKGKGKGALQQHDRDREIISFPGGSSARNIGVFAPNNRGKIITNFVYLPRRGGGGRYGGYDGYDGGYGRDYEYDGKRNGGYGDYDGADGNGGYDYYGGYGGGYLRGSDDGDYDRYVKQGQEEEGGGPAGPEESQPEEPSQEQEQAMNMDAVVKNQNEPGKSPTYYYYSENGNM